MKAMIPVYDVDIKRPENANFHRETAALATERLSLSYPASGPVIPATSAESL